jgi:hypothetical protein
MVYTSMTGESLQMISVLRCGLVAIYWKDTESEGNCR